MIVNPSSRSRFLLALSLVLFASLPGLAPGVTITKKVEKSQSITASTAGQYAVYAMMSSNAYHKRRYIDYPIEQLGWKRVDTNGKPVETPSLDHPLTGLAYDIWENLSNNEVVIAYRGTDGPWDFVMGNFAVPVSPAYLKAKKDFADYVGRNPEKKITVTGHSLGGAIALALSSSHKDVDAVVFNTSPRLFDGVDEENPTAGKRVLIRQQGDFLEFFRKRSEKFIRIVKPYDAYVCQFQYDNGHNHNINNLAREMLEFGATANPVLLPVRHAVFHEDGSPR